MSTLEAFRAAVLESVRSQAARLTQQAAQERRALVRSILGTEVTAFPDGSTVPDLADVVRVRMIRFRQEQSACPTCGADAGMRCRNHTPGLSCVARAALVQEVRS